MAFGFELSYLRAREQQLTSCWQCFHSDICILGELYGSLLSIPIRWYPDSIVKLFLLLVWFHSNKHQFHSIG